MIVTEDDGEAFEIEKYVQIKRLFREMSLQEILQALNKLIFLS